MSLLLAGAAASAAAQAPPGRPEFIEWARQTQVRLPNAPGALTPAMLGPLGKLIGAAPIVALSEAVHVGAEPLEFRNRLAEYLVQERGFTVIALESGVSEGELLYRYVSGGPGTADSAVANGMSWTFGDLPQNVELARWIRRYNDDARHPHKVRLYGFDVPGSPGNPLARRPLTVALDAAIAYLEQVDPAAARGFRDRLDPLRPFVRFDPRPPDTAAAYPRMAAPDRDRWSGAVADLIARLERYEVVYAKASGREAYEWGYRHAVGARQTDTWLRTMPVGAAAPTAGAPGWFKPATESRDRNMAANVEWILHREGPGAKLLIYASRYHISASPVRSGDDSTGSQVLGVFLRSRYGARLVTIGNLIDRGAWGCHSSTALVAATPESLDGTVATLGSPNLILDLRTAPRGLVDRVVPLGADRFIAIRPSEAFDLLWYIDSVRPACP